MKLFNELTQKNFELYAIRHYKNNKCLDLNEFYEDLARFKYVLRLLRRYKDSGELNIRLILNHLIVIYNIFDISAANRMMFFKIDPDLYIVLKPFLIYLSFLPEDELVNVPVDMKIAKQLQQI